MVKSKIFLVAIIGMLLLIPAISAAPSDYLEDPWVVFAIVFVLFFGIIYFAVNKATRSTAVSGAIAIALSLLISLAFSQRGLFVNFLGEDIAAWAVIGIFVVAAIFIMKLFIKKVGLFQGIVFGIALVLSVFVFADINTILPESLKYGVLEDFVTLMEEIGTTWLTAIIIAIILIFVWRSWRHGVVWRSRGGQIRADAAAWGSGLNAGSSKKNDNLAAQQRAMRDAQQRQIAAGRLNQLRAQQQNQQAMARQRAQQNQQKRLMSGSSDVQPGDVRRVPGTGPDA
jgi:hypothetical protein